MTATSSVSSNALNFMSSMENGVDPRTGLYTVSISLPEIQTNDLRGPGFGLALAYSPLNTLDSGYGFGWNLQLSQYTPGTRILSLSTGETFKVTGRDSPSGQLTMKEKRLDSFHFYEDEVDRYRVMHKSGLVEILEVQGSTQNRVALPVEIHSPTGHKIKLGYQTFNSDYQILAWVKDNTDQTLLSVKRETTQVELLLQPFGGPDGGPLARYVMALESSNSRVSAIRLPQTGKPDDPLASWRFEYRLIDGLPYMSAVETPSGGREEMYYEDLGHQFPTGSGRKPLPRVTRHLSKPGLGQPPTDVRFTYKRDIPGESEKNFLGFGLTMLWEEDGLDNLYKHIGDYEYATVETLWVDGQAKRRVERSFNQFHLLTKQATIQNNNVETVETEYFLTPNVAYDGQPNYCQMPKSVRTIWSLLNNPNRRRSEPVSSTYDNFGNMLTQTQANGVVEISTWYSAGGGDGCPPDPEGFVRQLKDKTIKPAPSPNDQAPTLRTRYRYKALPALADSPLNNWLTLESQMLLEVVGSDEIELERTAFEHKNEPTNAFLHGRVTRQTVTLNQKSTHIVYDYRKLISPQFNLPVQETTETVSTSFDGVNRAIVRQHSLLTSQELLNRSDGVETHYKYDVLGRLLSEEVAPGTDFSARRQYQYLLSSRHGQQAEYISINAKNIKTRSVLDGLGRMIFQERDQVHADVPSRAYQTHAAVYNAWGNLVEQTEFDWLDGVALPLKSRFFYDDWAQQCQVIGADGVEAHRHINPIGTEESQGPIHRSWVQSPGLNPIISGRSETWMNLFGKPIRTSALDATENEIAVETFLYDGLGRTTQQTDPLKIVTRFAYDAWSRLVSSTLPDQSVVTRTYADHSTSDLPVGLKVTGSNAIEINVGEQEFDGLGRLTRTTTGKRTELRTYKDDQLQVKTRKTPAEQVIEYDYNLTLSGQPISSSAPDEKASFIYDGIGARLAQASNEQGCRKYDYNIANQLLGESWVDKQEKTWGTLYSSSMQGRQLKRTEAIQDGSGGLDTVYTYDVYGRVKTTTQDQLQVGFEYNNLGQLSKITTKDLTANTTLVTELKYDDQGREILRSLTSTGQPARTLEQIWQADGMLESRHLQQTSVSLLKETFGYDPRGRLTRHDCEGTTLPRDSEGREFKKQTFTFDALDNLKIVMTTFPDDKSERAIFTYATDDPCQLKTIAYSPARQTANPAFTYNLNGCQLNDERGQKLTYDSQNRLLNVEASAGQIVSRYQYDSHDHLITSQHGNDSEALRFYQNEQLSTVVQDGRKTRLLYQGDQPLGQQVAGDHSQTLLLQTDANHSVIAESQQTNLRTAVYSAYGERHSEKPMFSLRAFNGEVRENSGWYLLGRGYRAYNPTLMRFHSPDSLSPFGSGGVNPYTYCLGNPIALRDPTGHSAIGYSGRPRRPDEDAVPGRSQGGSKAWLGWVFVVVGALATAAGVAATIVTAGAAAPLAGKAFAFTVAKAVSLGTGTAMGAASTAANAVSTATGDKEAGEWGMYLGLAAIPFVATTTIFAGAASYMKSLTGLDDILARLKPDPTGTMWGFSNATRLPTIPRAQLIKSTAPQSAVTNSATTTSALTPKAPPPPPPPVTTVTTATKALNTVTGPADSDLFKQQIAAFAESMSNKGKLGTALDHANETVSVTSKYDVKASMTYILTPGKWQKVEGVSKLRE